MRKILIFFISLFLTFDLGCAYLMYGKHLTKYNCNGIHLVGVDSTHIHVGDYVVIDNDDCCVLGEVVEVGNTYSILIGRNILVKLDRDYKLQKVLFKKNIPETRYI